MDEGKADEPGGADDKEILEIAKLISPEFEVCTFVWCMPPWRRCTSSPSARRSRGDPKQGSLGFRV